MASVIKHGKSIYSISDMNTNHEFVVIKLSPTRQGVMRQRDVRIIEAANEMQVKSLIRRYPFNMFKKLEAGMVEQIKNNENNLN